MSARIIQGGDLFPEYDYLLSTTEKDRFSADHVAEVREDGSVVVWKSVATFTPEQIEEARKRQAAQEAYDAIMRGDEA